MQKSINFPQINQYKSDKKMKYTIKESQLHKMIAESVKKVLKEAYMD